MRRASIIGAIIALAACGDVDPASVSDSLSSGGMADVVANLDPHYSVDSGAGIDVTSKQGDGGAEDSPVRADVSADLPDPGAAETSAETHPPIDAGPTCQPSPPPADCPHGAIYPNSIEHCGPSFLPCP